ncbi:SDR family NAD(P)-dependent oxidoreductase [Nocardioides sp. 31GB23]|uniref:SDR family NAD(P)-dependent oxidoreductase n=1 Tax=Nocardioides sp. 31GB23 TaxID=3156065 RepID=UPI0032AEC1AC
MIAHDRVRVSEGAYPVEGEELSTTMSFAGRTAVISGGGRGLGRTYALEMAHRGASIVINDPGSTVTGTGSAAAAEEVVAEIQTLGGHAVASRAAVSDQASAIQVIDTAVEEFGSCDIVINSAGILRDRTFENMSEDEYEAVMQGHATGPFFLTQAAFRQMKVQGYGRVVFTSSAAGLFGNFGQSNYALAKNGIVGLTKVLALEGARHGILVNAVAPVAATRMAAQGLTAGLPEAMDPHLVTPLVLYLASEASTHTMKTFSAGGGHFAEVFVSESRGWTSDGIVQPEDVAAHMPLITSRDEPLEFGNAFEEIAHVCREARIPNPYGDLTVPEAVDG